VLGRIYFGIGAYREAIHSLDAGTISPNEPGGICGILTRVLHLVSAITLVCGLALMAAFSYVNMGGTSGTGKTDPKTANSATGKTGASVSTPAGAKAR
jgi:hypothetical protein